MSGWLAAAVDGEDLVGRAASHEVAVVAAPGVVVHEPGVDLGLELSGAGEAPAVERGAPALLEGGALEAFTHGVVVRRPGRDPDVGQSLGRDGGAEGAGLVLGAVVGEHGPDGVTHPAPSTDDLV